MAWVVALSVVAIITSIYSLSAITDLKFFAVNEIKVYGTDPETTDMVSQAARSVLSGRYLGLFSRAASLIYPRSELVAAVAAASPKIQSVDVSRQGLTAIVVSVREKSPSALVCATLPDFEGDRIVFGDQDDCYFADETGYMFGRAPSFSGHIYHRYYVPGLADAATSSQSMIGTYATTTAAFRALEDTYAGVIKIGIPVEAMLLKDGGEYEMYVDQPGRIASSTDDGGANIAVIYLTKDRFLADQITNLAAFWNRMVTSVGSKAPSFEYIDVRYGSNVFYRLAK